MKNFNWEESEHNLNNKIARFSSILKILLSKKDLGETKNQVMIDGARTLEEINDEFDKLLHELLP
ncbi:MAG: hypothetical protein OEY33_09620 [Bdellovibrionales bacterium]|nr:hypothetical protein [Bdellovibrionales bacterium]